VRHGGEAPKTLKIRARVVSSVHAPAVSGFRHGLSFVRSKDDGLEILAEILGAAESTGPGQESIPTAHSAATPAAPAMQSGPPGSGRLARLKQLALAKQSQEKKSESQEEINARISRALERAFRYLKEFTGLLNIVKPAYAKAYSNAGLPKFDGLAWEHGRVDFRSRETSPTTKVCELVTLHFQLSGNKQVRVIRDSPADEELKQMLLETGIKFTTQEECNERGSIVGTAFVLPCRVESSLHLVGNFDTGKLLLRTRNIEHFSVLGYVLSPEAITEESLDELTAFILGESSRIGPLLLKNA
jgi:hypothetical protein